MMRAAFYLVAYPFQCVVEEIIVMRQQFSSSFASIIEGICLVDRKEADQLLSKYVNSDGVYIIRPKSDLSYAICITYVDNGRS